MSGYMPKISAALTLLSSDMRMDVVSRPLSNVAMEFVEETRRQKLAQLVRDYGTVSALADAVQKSSSQVSQWLNASPDSKTGKPRSISAPSARHIETRTGKPSGWMDQPISENIEPAVVGARRVPLISHVQAGLIACGHHCLLEAFGKLGLVCHEPEVKFSVQQK